MPADIKKTFDRRVRGAFAEHPEKNEKIANRRTPKVCRDGHKNHKINPDVKKTRSVFLCFLCELCEICAYSAVKSFYPPSFSKNKQMDSIPR